MEISIPLRVWGDGASVNKRWSLLAVTVASLFCTLGASLDSRLFVFGVPDKRYLDLDPLWSVFGWSLSILANGVMPSHDHLGRCFPEGSHRARSAGRRVAGIWRMFLADSSADLEHYVKTYAFETFHNTCDCCFQCFATKRPTRLNAYNFSLDAPWTFYSRSHAQYMLNTGCGVAAAWAMPGWHLTICRYDLMHSMMLGTLPILMGGAFFYLLGRNYFNGPSTGPWQLRFTYQLTVAFAQYKTWLRLHRLMPSERPFTIHRLSLSSAKSDPPVWKGKAGNN